MIIGVINENYDILCEARLRLEDRYRIAAREAGNAVTHFGIRIRVGDAGAHGVQEALDREVHETVGAEVSRELRGPEMVRDQLVARRDVDAHVTRVLQRRRRDPQVHLQRARLSQHRHDRLYMCDYTRISICFAFYKYVHNNSSSLILLEY